LKGNRRLQGIFERLGAVGAHQLGPARQIARRADRERTALKIAALLEALDRQLGGDRRYEVENAHPRLGRHVAGRIAEPG
jgi:hypothetical protein